MGRKMQAKKGASGARVDPCRKGVRTVGQRTPVGNAGIVQDRQHVGPQQTQPLVGGAQCLRELVISMNMMLEG